METLVLIAVSVLALAAVWTLSDASRIRDEHAIGVGPGGVPPQRWAALTFLTLLVSLRWYAAARDDAVDEPRRSGPPPRFETGGLQPFAFVVAVAGLALFAGLLVLGEPRASILGLLVIGVGWFGGREVRDTGVAETFALPSDAGWEQVGFVAPENVLDDEDDDELLDLDRVAARRRRQMADAAASLSPPSAPRPETARAPSAFVPPAPPVAAPGESLFTPPVPEDDLPEGLDAAAEIFVPPSPTRPATTKTTTMRSAPDVARNPPVGAPEDDVIDLHSLLGDEIAARPAKADVAPAPTVQRLQQPTLAVDDRALERAVRRPAPRPSPPPAPPPSTPTPTPTQTQTPTPTPSVPASPQPPATPAAATPARSATTPQSPPPPRRPQPPSRPQPPPPPPPRPQPTPPRPAADPPPRPTSRPRSATAPPSGFAAARRSRRRLVVPLLVGALVVGAALVALVVFDLVDLGLGGDDAEWMSPVADGAAVETAPAGRPDDSPRATEAEPDETPASEPSRDEPAALEAVSAELAAAMDDWIPEYRRHFGPVALLVEEIDFEGFNSERCDELSQAVNDSRQRLEPSPDDQIRAALASAMPGFDSATVACAERDVEQWSKQILAAKAGTHEAQQVLAERYGERGPLELDLESELGESRSQGSMTGRYLAQQELDF